MDPGFFRGAAGDVDQEELAEVRLIRLNFRHVRNDRLGMKRRTAQERLLKEYKWDDLATLRLETGFFRDQLVRKVNQRFGSPSPEAIDSLEALATVDELLQSASDDLEFAKRVLFEFCCHPAQGQKTP